MGVWRCVKCGAGGVRPVADLVPASGRARSRWRKFVTLVRCPLCGDDRGHAGVIEVLPGESLRPSGFAPMDRREPEEERQDPRLPAHPAAARRAAAGLARLAEYRGGERAVQALVAWRGLPEPLARAIAARGVAQIGEADAAWIRRHLPEEVAAALRPLLRGEGLLIPIHWFLPRDGGLHLAAVQVRYRRGEPRYRTGRLFRDWTPPAALLLPGGGPPLREEEEEGWPFRDGKGPFRLGPRVLLTEGWFKAVVAAELLGWPAVGFLGLPRQVEEVARRLRAAGVQKAWLAPDRDDPSSLAAERAFRRMARALRAAGIQPFWLRWPHRAGKGIDDALLAGWRPDFIHLEKQADKIRRQSLIALQAS